MSTKAALLEDGAIPAHKREQVRRMLVQGPWCWPTSTLGVTRAKALAGSLPAAPIGAALVATEAGTAAALYAYRPDDKEGEVAMNQDGASAVERAKSLLGHSCGALRNLPHRKPSTRLRLLDKHILANETPDPTAVHGDSLGVSVLLGQASACLQLAVPTDLIALCSLEESGQTRGVKGLSRKMEAVKACAPRVQRFLVAPADADEARQTCAKLGFPDAAVVTVKGAADAIHAAFGDDLPGRMVDALRPEERAPFVEHVLNRCLEQERDVLLSWRPVWQIAEAALEAWAGGPEDLNALRLVHAIAVRHDNADEDEFLNEHWDDFSAWVAALPKLRRLRVLAHLVQQNSDRCTPDDERLQALLASSRPSHSDSEQYAKLLGAEGRRAALRGRLDEAWATQCEAYDIFLEGAHTQRSYQLSALYQLAGFFGDPSRIRAVDELKRRAEPIGRLHSDGERYVRLARFRALVQAGCLDAEVMSGLRAIADDGGAPAHVRASALVWFAVAHRWDASSFDPAYASLRGKMKEGDHHLCRGYPPLWRLLAGADADVPAAFDELCQHEPLVIASMLACRPADLPKASEVDARAIARRFPY